MEHIRLSLYDAGADVSNARGSVCLGNVITVISIFDMSYTMKEARHILGIATNRRCSLRVTYQVVQRLTRLPLPRAITV